MSKSGGALNNYLREVGRVSLLRPYEEIELARKVRSGEAAARERMIHANLRLVVTHLDRLLKTLNERETTIIAHRYGLNGTAVKSLEQVGELIGVTHERVRRLEVAALAKLRRSLNGHRDPVESEIFAAAIRPK